MENSEAQIIRVAIDNVNEGIKEIQAATASPESTQQLRHLLLLSGQTNYQISQVIHHQFGIELSPAEKMSPSYHINLPRLLRNELFSEDDPAVKVWQQSVALRNGIEHPRAKINIHNPRFDEVIAELKSDRLSGKSYSAIAKNIQDKYKIKYENPNTLGEFVHANPDLFLDLIKYDSENINTARMKALTETNKSRANFLRNTSVTTQEQQKIFKKQIETIERLRVDRKLTWDEINELLYEELGVDSYKNSKQLRKRVRMLTELGLFPRLTLDLDSQIQAKQVSNVRTQVGEQSRSVEKEEEKNIYEKWIKSGDSLNHFSQTEGTLQGVSQNTIRRIINRQNLLNS